MAELALLAVGTLLAPSLAIPTGLATTLFVGSFVAAGAVIDSQFLFPAIFGRPSQSVGKLSDLKAQVASEGSAMNYCLGPENRVGGTVIWMTDLKEHKSKQGGKGGGGGSYTTYSYSVSAAIGICEGPIAGIGRIWADGKLIYDANNGGADKRAKSLTIYLGTDVQDPDPVMEAIEGAANVPAYRGLAYIVVEDLRLADWGNRLPQFNIEVIAQNECPIRDGISLLLERAGLTSDQFDASFVTGCIRGYNWSGPKSMRDAILPLMTAYSIRAQEAGGVLRFFSRGEEDYIDVDESDLAAEDASSGGRPDQVAFTDVAELTLPTECNVNYYDSDRDLQQGSQSAHRSAVSGSMIASLEVPLVMLADDAQAIAQRQLWTAWAERVSATVQLPQSYMATLESDVLVVPFQGNEYQIRAVEVNRGANFVMEVKGLIQDPDVNAVFGNTEPTTFHPPTILDSQAMSLAVMDLPALVTEDQNKPGVYLAACNLSTELGWKGATVYVATEADGTYAMIATLTGQADMGSASTRLMPGTTLYWDNVNTVDVELDAGELESATASEVLAGANFALLGSEIIAFQNAELLATRKYRLSGLLRGRRNTERSMYGHAKGEQFLILTPRILGRYTTNSASINGTRFFKAVPPDGVVADYDAVPGMAGGANLTPFSPCLIRVHQETNGDKTITWARRTRGVVNILGPVDQLDLDKYDIVLAHEGRAFRTLTCTDDTRTVTWTDAQQTSDAITGNLSVTVYQLSKTLGRGNPGVLSMELP